MAPRELRTPVVRPLREADAEELVGFVCANGLWFEEDVEWYIRNRLWGDHLNRRWEEGRDELSHVDHRLLGLFSDDHGLVGVCAHEQLFAALSGENLIITRLQVSAVVAAWQGAVLVDQEPDHRGRRVTVGKYMAMARLADALGRGRTQTTACVVDPRAPFAEGVVARDNERSLRICDYLGLRHEQDDPDPRFVRRSGRLSEQWLRQQSAGN